MKVNTTKMKKKFAALGMCLVVGMANFAAPVSEIGDQFLSTGCISASAASVSSGLQEKQTSAKNKNLLLNDSNRLTKVGNYGCAMMSNYYMAIQTGLLSPDTSVKEFLTRLKKVSAFDREGYITWTKITKVIPEITYNKKITLSGKSRSAAISEITKQLKNGKKCIVQVSTKYGNHYVYCYTSGSSVKIADSSFSYGSLNNSAYTTIKAVLIYDVKGGKKVVDNSSKVRYYKACSAHYNSLVDALKSIKVESSYSFRAKIAKANNIPEYRGRADENTHLLNLLKKGQLKAV